VEQRRIAGGHDADHDGFASLDHVDYHHLPLYTGSDPEHPRGSSTLTGELGEYYSRYRFRLDRHSIL
jgi:hypothetical protein